MPAPRITVVDHWKRYERDIEQAVVRSLGHMGSVVAHEAESTPTKYHIRGILGKLRVNSVRRTSRAWLIEVVAVDFREIFFEKGTYRHRRAKVKQPGRRKAGSELRGGVKAGHHLRKGLNAARPRLVRLLEAEMARIRGLP